MPANQVMTLGKAIRALCALREAFGDVPLLMVDRLPVTKFEADDDGRCVFVSDARDGRGKPLPRGGRR
jgi:hypothetical protein